MTASADKYNQVTKSSPLPPTLYSPAFALPCPQLLLLIDSVKNNQTFEDNQIKILRHEKVYWKKICTR